MAWAIAKSVELIDSLDSQPLWTLPEYCHEIEYMHASSWVDEYTYCTHKKGLSVCRGHSGFRPAFFYGTVFWSSSTLRANRKKTYQEGQLCAGVSSGYVESIGRQWWSYNPRWTTPFPPCGTLSPPGMWRETYLRSAILLLSHCTTAYAAMAIWFERCS